jgi:hypothetical protein
MLAGYLFQSQQLYQQALAHQRYPVALLGTEVEVHHPEVSEGYSPDQEQVVANLLELEGQRRVSFLPAQGEQYSQFY